MAEGRFELPLPVVDITTPGWNARLGRYFIGQTSELHVEDNYSAWAGLINPWHSQVNLYFDIFTITNYGDQSFTAEIWLNAEPPYSSMEVPHITSSNQAINPLPRPKALMLQAEGRDEELKSGTNIFDRIVTPNSTLVSDSHQGSIILGPGGTFSIRLISTYREMISSAVVLTWWEEHV